LFKKGYKVIVIKDGQFDLKQFHLNKFTFSLILLILPILFLGFYFLLNTFNPDSISNKNSTIYNQAEIIKDLEHKNKTQENELKQYEELVTKQIKDNDKKIKKINDMLVSNQKKSDKIVKVLFDTKGLSRESRKAGSGGELDNDSNKINIDNSDIQNLYNKSLFNNNMINKLFKKINIESIYLANIETKFNSNIKYWSSVPSRMPMDIKRGIYISSYYGYRDDPFSEKRQFHAGDDFSAKIGTPVKSTGDGVVSKARFDSRFGNFIEIDHGYGFKTIYAHMKDGLLVKKGDKVKRGQSIGYLGNTGRSTAPHLHYEVKFKNKTVNPRKYYTYDKKLEQLIYYR
tara:strand:- start:4231 stop:5259 length:1029 start_codon:yes stop_codon:yes gene_type:complete